jgi:hypothetical protein
VELKFDQRLESGEVDLVEKLTPMELGGKTRRLYSFATKYCHYHAPGRFVIYDSYVEQMLIAFIGLNNFTPFDRAILKKYDQFSTKLSDFRNCFSLNEFSLQDLDLFLWLEGRKRFSPVKK